MESAVCEICGEDTVKKYGEIGRSLIQVQVNGHLRICRTCQAVINLGYHSLDVIKMVKKYGEKGE